MCVSAVKGTYAGDGVKGGVGADAEVRAGDVVGDGGRDNHHGNAHLLVFLPGLNQLQASHVGLQQRKESFVFCCSSNNAMASGFKKRTL